jgi:DUF1680 family protein
MKNEMINDLRAVVSTEYSVVSRRKIMALMDKMKAQAAQLAQKAQEAGKAGQSKIEEVQAKRRADGLLRQLGQAVYAQHIGTATPETNGKIDSLIAELKAYEDEHGLLAAASVDDDEAAETRPPPYTPRRVEGRSDSDRFLCRHG